MGAIPLALFAAVLWGVGQVFTKRGYEESTPLFNNLLAAVVTIATAVPFALLNGATFQLSVFPLTVVIAALLLCYYYILAKGQVSLTGTVLSSYPIITITLSFIFLQEQPSLFQKLAIVAVLLGTILIAAGEGLSHIKEIKLGDWFWIAIAGALSIGTSDFLSKVANNKTDVYSYLLDYGIAYCIVAGISYFFDKKGRTFPAINNMKFLPTLIGVTMIEIGLFVYYLAISKGLVSLVTPISSVFAAITVVLAWIFLKERVKKLQVVGILFSVAGIILIGIG